MGQLLLPIFPADTQMITMTLGVREHGNTVYYLHSGVPIFSHESNDLTKFRYVTSHLILQGLWMKGEVPIPSPKRKRYQKVASVMR